MSAYFRLCSCVLVLRFVVLARAERAARTKLRQHLSRLSDAAARELHACATLGMRRTFPATDARRAFLQSPMLALGPLLRK